VTSAVTDISITVPIVRANAAGEERVAIRMVQRAGEIHVSVRTPDSQGAQALRQDLGRLASSLNEAGFRTETWRPGAVNATSASTQTHKEFSQDTPNRDRTGSNAQSGGSQGRGAGEQKRRQQDERPRWVAELETQTNR
jgi:hypothetical protein